MKLNRILMIVTLLGGTMWAQTATRSYAVAKSALAKESATPPAGSAHTPAKPAAAKAPVTAAKTPATAKQTSAKPAAPVHHAPAVKPSVEQKKPAAEPKKVAEHKAAVEKKAETEKMEPEMVARPASAKVETVSRVGPRRDPFLSPIVRATGGGPACETGKRCLVVDQISLKGIVKSPNGYIAVVENPMKRAYFLRVNDPVFNGSVVKITDNSVTFREATTDKLGKQTTREVVKTVNAPVV